MPADLPALAARLREARGPNYQLGLDVIAAFVEGDPMLWMRTHGDPTASIDSIVALVRKVEPGCQISMFLYEGGAIVSIWRGVTTIAFRVMRPTLPLALCLALVEWRIAHGGA